MEVSAEPAIQPLNYPRLVLVAQWERAGVLPAVPCILAALSSMEVLLGDQPAGGHHPFPSFEKTTRVL